MWWYRTHSTEGCRQLLLLDHLLWKLPLCRGCWEKIKPRHSKFGPQARNWSWGLCSLNKEGQSWNRLWFQNFKLFSLLLGVGGFLGSFLGNVLIWLSKANAVDFQRTKCLCIHNNANRSLWMIVLEVGRGGPSCTSSEILPIFFHNYWIRLSFLV